MTGKSFEQLLQEIVKILSRAEESNEPFKQTALKINAVYVERLTQKPFVCKARPRCILPHDRCLTCGHNYGLTINPIELLEELKK